MANGRRFHPKISFAPSARRIILPPAAPVARSALQPLIAMSTPRFRPRLLPLLALLASAWPALPAAAGQRDFDSHQVNADHSVTFRYYAPTAKSVTLSLDYDHHDLPMREDAGGVWTLTTPPLASALHMYAFTVDGTGVYDPLNPDVDFSYGFRTNTVEVPGPVPQPWDDTDVPHGVIHYHLYRSAILQGLPHGEEDYYVYTPPGYDPAASTRYPVLYLLHGWSAVARSWLRDGQANFIFDNLIAQHRIRPMIVVMPLGYGYLGFVTNGFQVWNDPANIARNLDLFQSALLREIIPQVEGDYRVRSDAADRAIAGLSMGGGESLAIGLNHPGLFSWVGGFSPAVVFGGLSATVTPAALDAAFPHLGAAPKVLWVSCGTSDDLIGPTRAFVAWLRSKGLHPDAVETPGIHNWPVWRDNLVHFAPLLFGGP
jgi:enterochelin esterase-like enzyme